MSAEAGARERVRALDAYRGVAVVLMIAAHACDAFLAERFKHSMLWHGTNLLFGFVAPAFLLLSGSALWLSLRRSTVVIINDESLTPRRSLSATARRYGIILALAYWLQIPVLSLRQLVWNQRPSDLARLFDSNILHVVALTGLALVALRAAMGEHAARYIAALIAAVLVIAAPYLWSDAHPTVWYPLRAFITAQPDATFPLAPFAAYMLLGFAIAPLLERSGTRRAVIITSTGVALLVMSFIADAAIGSTAPHDNYWYGSAQHSLMRAGVIVIGAALMMLLRPRDVHVTILERIGRASLPVYVLHLMLIYGSPMTMGVRDAYGSALRRSLDPLSTVLMFVVITVVVCSAALAAPAIQRGWPRVAQTAWWIWWAVFVLFFVLTP